MKQRTTNEWSSASSLTLEQWERLDAFVEEKPNEAIRNNILNHNFDEYTIETTTVVDYKPALILFVWLTVYIFSLFVVHFVISRVWYYIYFGKFFPNIK